MPLISIKLTAGNLGTNPCFTGPDAEQARFNAYVAKIQSSLPINFTTAIVQTTAPGATDRDKIWIKVDGSGRILGTFLFSNGTWQTIFPTNPYIVPGEKRMYDPLFYTPAQTADEPWFPMDGTVAGVDNYSGCYIVGAGQRTLTAAQIAAGDTATVFAQGSPGGAEQNFLTSASQVPGHLHTGRSYVFDDPLGTPIGGVAGGTGLSNGSFTGANIPRATPAFGQNTDPFKVLPPFQAVHFMQWRPDLV